MKSSPEDLIRIVRCKQRLQEYNLRRPAHLRHSKTQIDDRARSAVRNGLVNEHGVIINSETKK